MDRERFGRVLGAGARGAATTLARMADAALAPDPRAPKPQVRNPQVSNPQVPNLRARPQPALGTTATVGNKRQRPGLTERLKAIWSPAARASRVLWLEFTGSFFALFALAMAVETWKRRADFAVAGRARGYAWVVAILLIAFGWFAVSSFVEASRRSRR